MKAAEEAAAAAGDMSRKTLWIEVIAVVALSMLVRVADIDHDPIHDELYHLLAAQSWVADGDFDVADGQYRRGALYTMFVGSVYAVFGDDVSAVRISSAALGALWVGLVFLWCRLKFSQTTAWVAAVLFCLAPGAIFLSQYIRFYALHGLLFWIGAVAVYEVIELSRSWKSNVLLAALAALCFAMALHLQVTTAIGIAGIGAYAAIRWLPAIWGIANRTRISRNFSIAVVGILLLGLAVFLNTAVFRALLTKYTIAPLWATGGGPLRYHWIFVDSIPVLWGLFPVAILLAISRRSWPGIFCATVFVVAFVGHSFAGVKGERYIYYAMPFLFALSGYLLAHLLAYAYRTARAVGDGWNLPSPMRRSFPVLAVLVVTAGLLLSNPSARITADMLRGQETSSRDGSSAYWSRYESDWDASAAEIRKLAERSDIVVTSQGLHLLYYVGDYDIELSGTRLSDLYLGNMDKLRDFTMDFRTGRPVVSQIESMQQIVACNASGIVVVRDHAWRNDAYVDDDVADYLERHARRVDLPAKYGLTVFRWESSPAGDAATCREPLARRQAVVN